MSRGNDLKRFYQLLGELEQCLGGLRQLSQCDGHMDWPQRGVYFFLEEGENRSDSGSGPRVVRVGTHALRESAATCLWGRLYGHRGRESLDGNHRGSVFRKLVGTALMERDGWQCATWGQGSSASREICDGERELEHAVSGVLGAMSVLWLAVDDAPGPGSLRAYVERNAIALLSNWQRAALDAPSADWLGHHCDRERVRGSGLWNQDHVGDSYDPGFLDTLDKLVVAVG